MATDVPATGIKKKAGFVAAGVTAAAVIGGGVWAGVSFFSQGAQPAEALPADTLAYAAVDLDPSGGQKIEAIRFLRKFPGIQDELDLDTDDDLKLRIFEEMQEDGVCEDLDYGDDIEPWLGDRAAFAVVDRGDDDPAPVYVVQIKDEDAAKDGLDKIIDCEPYSDDEPGGYAFTGEWAVVAETEETAENVVAVTEESPLSDDGDFQRLAEEVGEAGVLNLYAAPAAGAALMDEFGEDFLDGFGAELGGGEAGEDVAEQFAAAIEKFPGVAGTLRFTGGDVEFEMATGKIDRETREMLAMGGDRAGDVVTSLPGSTVAAFAWAFPEGWGDAVVKFLGPSLEQEAGLPLDDAIAEFEAVTGLRIPEDVETLTGEGLALVVDESITSEDLEGEDPTALPAGLRIRGDAEKIEEVLDKVRALAGPGFGELIVSDAEGDFVAVGTNKEYVEKLAKGGDLGSKKVFEDAIPNPDDTALIYFIDFDTNDWLDKLVEEFEDDEAAENVEPLSSFGVSSWETDGKSHLLLKLRTE